jgi:prolipoprotein diacylglyceryltransferase
MQQVLFHIPIPLGNWLPDGIPIYGFGVMLFIAFVLCTWLVSRRAEQEGISKNHIQDLAIFLFVGGITGARLTFLIAEKEKGVPLTQSLSQFFNFTDGGLVLYGCVPGGLLGYLLAYYFIFRKAGVSTWKMADCIAPAFAVGIGLGRIGCFLNGCCYGEVATCAACPHVSFPLSAWPRFALVDKGYQTAAGFTLVDPEAARVGKVAAGSPAEHSGLRADDVIVGVEGQEVKNGRDLDRYLVGGWKRGKNDLSLTVERGSERLELPAFRPWTLGLHPTQLYETVSMLLLFLLLTAYFPLRKRPGEVMALLMLGYGVHRYLDEMLRADARPTGFEMYVSIFLVVSGVALWLWRRRPFSAGSELVTATT